MYDRGAPVWRFARSSVLVANGAVAVFVWRVLYRNAVEVDWTA